MSSVPSTVIEASVWTALATSRHRSTAWPAWHAIVLLRPWNACGTEATERAG